MRLNVEENLIDQPERNSSAIESEIESFLDTNEGQNIKEDIALLNEMGFDKKMINKVYILFRPENIERAIDYMSDRDGIYQHNFIASTHPKEKNLCFICKRLRQNHMDYIPSDILNEGMNNNFVNREIEIININDNEEISNKNKDKNENDFLSDECEVCYEEINEEDKSLNSIPCGHLFCTHCWFNYLKTSILEAKVDNIKCMNHECQEIMTGDFILKHLSEDNNLKEKYLKFKKRAEIIKDKNKKLCPNPDCDSFLQKSVSSKYVKCENGHKYCFECLKPPHGKKSCDYKIEKEFMKWKKGKRVKRCPRCQMYTEKNEGCNHMTCVSCKYQWCWLCEGKYSYGHYDSGRCSGQQFTKANDIKEIEKRNDYFGLHKIFKCVYQPIKNQIELEGWENYLLMLGFWIFGIVIIFIYVVGVYFDNEIKIITIDKVGFALILFGISLGVFCAFQIPFTCLLTPFILISLICPKFFNKLLLFFEVGND